MLIPNKFNGYQADGCRLLHVGGGVGEAALLGAAMGGGAAAVTGGDPLKGALLGGLTGGIGGGLGGVPAATTAGTAGASALPAGATVAATATPAVLPTGVTAGTLPAAALPAATTAPITTAAAAPITTAAAPASGITTLPAATEQAAANIMSQQHNLSAMHQALAQNPGLEAGRILENSLQSGLDVGGMNPAQMTPAGVGAPPTPEGTFMEGMQRFIKDPIASIKRNPFPAGISALTGAVGARKEMEEPGEYDGPLKRFRYDPNVYRPQFAEGGIASLTSMPVERMSDRNDTMAMMASRGQMYAGGGGISSLGSYSDGGRMLKGPGDGMSDSIPASISNKRPARLADGEFVVPADVVSHLGNGSTDAGARQLYSMMDKVRSARTGTKKQGRQINSRKMMPA
jgi:hypothetical protein